MSNEIKVYRNLMESNQSWADKIRDFLKEKKIIMVNIIGSPGCGKTTLLENLFHTIDNKEQFAVLEGDVETENDALRLKKHNVQVVQLITSGGCHLQAAHVHEVLQNMDLSQVRYIIIENVGNLVCPAEFDLGEAAKIAVLSCTEGEDKPVKYPLLFQEAKCVLLTKTDLLPYLPFNKDLCIDYIKKVNLYVPIFPLSSIKNEGITEFIEWLKNDVS
jgi:hydrogenase nickel incorporation protein HypB